MLHLAAWKIFLSQPRIEPTPSTLKAQSLHHQGNPWEFLLLFSFAFHALSLSSYRGKVNPALGWLQRSLWVQLLLWGGQCRTPCPTTLPPPRSREEQQAVECPWVGARGSGSRNRPWASGSWGCWESSSCDSFKGREKREGWKACPHLSVAGRGSLAVLGPSVTHTEILGWEIFERLSIWQGFWWVRQAQVSAFGKEDPWGSAPESPAMSGPHILGEKVKYSKKGTNSTTKSQHITSIMTTRIVFNVMTMRYTYRNIIIWRWGKILTLLFSDSEIQR